MHLGVIAELYEHENRLASGPSDFVAYATSQGHTVSLIDLVDTGVLRFLDAKTFQAVTAIPDIVYAGVAAQKHYDIKDSKNAASGLNSRLKQFYATLDAVQAA